MTREEKKIEIMALQKQINSHLKAVNKISKLKPSKIITVIVARNWKIVHHFIQVRMLFAQIQMIVAQPIPKREGGYAIWGESGPETINTTSLQGHAAFDNMNVDPKPNDGTETETTTTTTTTETKPKE